MYDSMIDLNTDSLTCVNWLCASEKLTPLLYFAVDINRKKGFYFMYKFNLNNVDLYLAKSWLQWW